MHEQLTKPYDSLLGLPDDVGVPQYVALAAEVIGSEPSAEQITAALDAFCTRAASLPRPKINDQLLDPVQYARFDAETQGFRLLPARSCPSAVLMQRTVDPLVPGREIPSGLDFFATGDLACEPARRALLASVKNKVTFEAITGARTEPLPESLHGQALGILRLLQEPLPDQAPQPLRTAAWQDKQLWTALAAWAEQRHTWAGHIKLDYSVLNGNPLPHGYVSPYPRFFSAMVQLARDTATAFDSDPEGSLPQRAGRQLLRSLEIVRKAHKDSRWGESAWSERTRLGNFGVKLAQTINLDDSAPAGQSPLPDEILEGADVMDRIARRWIAGQNLDANDQEAMQYWAGLRPDCVGLLQGLAGVCDRLAAIAQKELDGQPLDGDDTYFIEDYGRTLAHLHSYTAQAYMSPVDDLPVVTPVFVSPVANQTLYAGIARPEALYVILEVDGQRVLHRGAVLSYREFTRPTQEPVDDTWWLNEIRTGQPPAPPAFTISFRSVTSAEEADASALMRQWSTGNEAWSPPVRQNSELPPGLIWSLIVVGVCVLGGLLVMWWRRPSQPSGSTEDGDGR